MSLNISDANQVDLNSIWPDITKDEYKSLWLKDINKIDKIHILQKLYNDQASEIGFNQLIEEQFDKLNLYIDVRQSIDLELLQHDNVHGENNIIDRIQQIEEEVKHNTKKYLNSFLDQIDIDELYQDFTSDKADNTITNISEERYCQILFAAELKAKSEALERYYELINNKQISIMKDLNFDDRISDNRNNNNFTDYDLVARTNIVNGQLDILLDDIVEANFNLVKDDELNCNITIDEITKSVENMGNSFNNINYVKTPDGYKSDIPSAPNYSFESIKVEGIGDIKVRKSNLTFPDIGPFTVSLQAANTKGQPMKNVHVNVHLDALGRVTMSASSNNLEIKALNESPNSPMLLYDEKGEIQGSIPFNKKQFETLKQARVFDNNLLSKDANLYTADKKNDVMKDLKNTLYKKERFNLKNLKESNISCDKTVKQYKTKSNCKDQSVNR